MAWNMRECSSVRHPPVAERTSWHSAEDHAVSRTAASAAVRGAGGFTGASPTFGCALARTIQIMARRAPEDKRRWAAQGGPICVAGLRAAMVALHTVRLSQSRSSSAAMQFCRLGSVASHCYGCDLFSRSSCLSCRHRSQAMAPTAPLGSILAPVATQQRKRSMSWSMACGIGANGQIRTSPSKELPATQRESGLISIDVA